MSRRLDIGIACFGHPELLQRTINSIREMSTTDYRIILVINPHPDAAIREAVNVIAMNALKDGRAFIVTSSTNLGYAGAVQELQRQAETEYIAYCDDDVVINTRGWDETLCSYLDRFHEIGMIFPNGGAYPIPRGPYNEIMWGVGFCWVLSRLAQSEVGYFDDQIGHQNEADYCLRVRMGGWKCASAPDVSVSHMATASNDPASNERISKGVREFVDKWCKYFGGKNLNYHSANVLRWEDWHPNALYLEEWWKLQRAEHVGNPGGIDLAALNAAPDFITHQGREYDLIQVPRYKGFYTNRII